MLLKISTIVLIPALIIQGYAVKKKTPILSEPKGVREGEIGSGKSLSILIIGDSAAAGVGVDHQKDALSGALLQALNNEFRMTWKLHAKTGDDSVKIIQAVTRLDQVHYDVIVSSVGVNDVTKLMSPKQWIQKQDELYQLVEKKFTPKIIIATGVPPMQMFPALPNPLGWLFGQYAKKMNEQLAKLINTRPKMQWVEYDIEKYQKLNIEMAIDGFHPSKEVYALWANLVADKIREKF